MEYGQYYTKGTTTYICCYHNEWQKMYLGGTMASKASSYLFITTLWSSAIVFATSTSIIC